MKKIIGMLCVVSVFAFVSCGEGKKNQVNTSEQSSVGENEESDGAWFMAQTDVAPVQTVSATSELVEAKFAGKYLYPPINILDGNFRTTWCEAVDGDGIGESVTVEFTEPVSFDEIQIVNGFATRESFAINNRIKKITITQVAGEHFQQKEYELADNVMGWQSIKFELPQTAKTIELKISDIYRGTQYRDTCLDDFRLLYRGKVIPFTGIEELRRIQEENSREMLSSDFEGKFKALFKSSADSKDTNKYLCLQEVGKTSGLVLTADTSHGFTLRSMEYAVYEGKEEYIDGIRRSCASGDIPNIRTVAAIQGLGDYNRYEIGNCRIIVESRISYVTTKTAQLVKINGNNVSLNGVQYKVVPSSTVYCWTEY